MAQPFFYRWSVLLHQVCSEQNQQIRNTTQPKTAVYMELTEIFTVGDAQVDQSEDE